MSRAPRLVMTEKTVVKSDTPRLMRVEVEKTRRAGRIGKDSGLFRVPEVLDYDDGKGVAVFERIPGLRTLRRGVAWGPEYVDLGGRLGTALAVVHRELNLPADMVVPLPEGFAAEGPDVFLHGDLGVENVGLIPGSSAPVILDWQFTGVHGGEATHGSRFFDVVWFVNTLIWFPTMSHLFGDPVGPVARAFIGSYFRTAGVGWDGEAMAGYAERFFEIKRPERRRMSRRQRVFIPRCQALTRRFIRSLRSGLR